MVMSFLLAAIVWTIVAAYIQGRGEPCFGLRDSEHGPEASIGLIEGAPILFSVIFFVLALAGAPSVVVYGALGGAFGALCWYVGSEANRRGFEWRSPWSGEFKPRLGKPPSKEGFLN